MKAYQNCGSMFRLILILILASLLIFFLLGCYQVGTQPNINEPRPRVITHRIDTYVNNTLCPAEEFMMGVMAKIKDTPYVNIRQFPTERMHGKYLLMVFVYYEWSE